MSNEQIDELISERIVAAMWRHKVTQVQLAQRMGTTQSNVSKMLHGRIRWRAAILAEIADALGVSVGELYPEPGQQPAAEAGGAVTRCIPPQPVRLRSVPTPVIAATRRHALSSAQIFGTLPCPA